jgi:polyhydroxyalkanoate synthesis regulator phasin
MSTVPQENDKDEKTPYTTFFQLSRKILLAGIGAATLAQEEIENFVNRLVDRGEIAEKDARQLAREIMDRREKMMRDWRTPAAPAQPPAATKADLDALMAKIAELNKKIDDLNKKQKSAE